MKSSKIKKYQIIIVVIFTNLFPSILLSQKAISEHDIIFEIVNYKKYFNHTDNVILSVKNVSNRQLWFSIGEEGELDKGSWTEFNSDIYNLNPSEEAGVSYQLLKPHESKIIKVNLKKISAPLIKNKHGISKPTRFFLKFGTKPAENVRKKTCIVFFEIY